MNYDRTILLMTYRVLHPSHLSVEPRTIAKMDQRLFDLYDEAIRVKAEAAGIPRNVRNRSLLLFFAMQSTKDDVAREVDDAIVYFVAVNPQ